MKGEKIMYGRYARADFTKEKLYIYARDGKLVVEKRPKEEFLNERDIFDRSNESNVVEISEKGYFEYNFM